MPDPGCDALRELFASTGVPVTYARHVAVHLGESAADALREDPWRLLLVPGIRPEQADHFARALLGPEAGPHDARRGRALVTHLMATAAREGHTATPGPQVVRALSALRVPDPVKAIEEALDEATVMAFHDEPDFDEAGFDENGDLDDLAEPDPVLGAARPALAEEALAEGIMRLAATAVPLTLGDETGDEAGGGGGGGAEGDGGQSPVASAAHHGVSVLRVPAGGDPDDALVALARTAATAGVRVRVACATLRAAGRLARHAGDGPAEAFTTLHHLLEARQAPGGIVYTRDERLPVDADLVIVPDAQTLGVEAAAALVEACADGTHLVLAGCLSELPSAAPGRVLGDLAGSGAVPVTDLPTAAEGPIAGLVAAIAQGRLPAVEAPGREVVIVPSSGAPEAVHRTLQLVGDSIPRALGMTLGDIQVVTAAPRGAAGVHALNAAIKRRLTGRTDGAGARGEAGPQTAAQAAGDTGAPVFDPGDRVIVTSALEEVPAGEIGTVRSVSADELTIDFTGAVVTVPAGRWSRLRHGWAITAPEAAGQRWPAVVAVFPPETPLSRPMVETVFGRAARHLSVVQAAGPALAHAVRDGSAGVRRTRLATLLHG